jgi:hypothetical protein
VQHASRLKLSLTGKLIVWINFRGLNMISKNGYRRYENSCEMRPLAGVKMSMLKDLRTEDLFVILKLLCGQNKNNTQALRLLNYLSLLS